MKRESVGKNDGTEARLFDKSSLNCFIAFAVLLLGVLGNFEVKAQEKAAHSINSPTACEKLLLDPGWKFHLGDAASMEGDLGYGSSESFAKAGSASGPARPDFNDSTWRVVNLPHDWAVELPFVYSKSEVLHDHGYKPLGREFPATSIGWYRRKFTIPKEDEGKHITVKFDGVFRDCTVWFNGFFLGTNLSGYTEFSFDVTDYVHYGKENALAVRVDATQAEGWFYEGAGIYRHVWLIKTAPLHIPVYGTYVTSDVTNGSAILNVRTTVLNQSQSKNDCQLVSVLLDRSGNEVARVFSSPMRLNDYEKKTIDQQIKVASPHLWDVDDPYLYKLVQLLKSADKVVDRTETTVGIRIVRFDNEKGFFLNGKNIKIKGTCNHQDHAGVGSALPDGLQFFRIEKLKEMGCNAYRTSHNPPTPELLDACDSLGMLVLDENRLMGSTPELTDQFKRMVLRDRNHPCVIAWSLGNEEWKIESNEIGAKVAAALKRIQKEYDPSRVCTMAANNGTGYKGINSVVDVRGVNYINIGDIDVYHKNHPDQPIWGTEEASTYCTRGVYAIDTVNGYMTDYDISKPSYGTLAEEWWKWYTARPWMAGGFAWTGFDYRGEPSPYTWPDINSHFGILDVCGFPKNNFYYYQSWWTDKNVLHIFPHWNWKGKEGQPIDVWCFSNCDSVELFLNGKSLGTKTMEPMLHLEWKVNYDPGTLEAHGWRNGKLLVAKEETTGDPAAIRLTPDRSSIHADGEDVSVMTVTAVDEQNREVPTADNLVHFGIEGEGEIIGIGNGNPSSHEPDKYLSGNYQRKLFNGKCEVIILSTRHAGKIELTANGDGLKSATTTIDTEPSAVVPIVGD